jgi:hypothetical protein
MVNSNTMKKLFLFFAFFPMISQAQFLRSFFQLYGEPMNAFYLDTSLYQSGLGKAKEYNVDVDGNFNLYIEYFWQTVGNKMVNKSAFYPTFTSYNYYETQYSFKDEKPFQSANFRRLIDQTLLEPNGTDSMAYENDKIKFVYRLTGNQNPGTISEYSYDSINGIKGFTIKMIPPSTTYTGLFEVREFYQPQKPKIIEGYTESATERKLSSISHYYFDSLNRVSYAIDSTLQFGMNMVFVGTRRVVYKGNTMLIDSFIQLNTLFKSYYVTVVSYDAQQKITQTNGYGQENNKPYRLMQRIEFENPSSGILDQTNTKLAVTLFPNPAFDRLNFKSERPIEAVEIYDLTGTLVFKQNAIEKESLSINKLTPGIYLIKLSNEQGASCQRLVVSQ